MRNEATSEQGTKKPLQAADALAAVRDYATLLTEDQRPEEDWAEYAFRRMRAQGVHEVIAYLTTVIENHERGPNPWDEPHTPSDLHEYADDCDCDLCVRVRIEDMG